MISTFVNQYLLEWAHGHNPADLGIGGTPGQLAAFVAKGYSFPGRDSSPVLSPKTSSSRAYLQSGVFKGVHYTLPFMGEVMMFSVNKPMLQKAGLLGAEGQAVAPKTWVTCPLFLQETHRGERQQARLLDPLGLQLRDVQLLHLPSG